MYYAPRPGNSIALPEQATIHIWARRAATRPPELFQFFCPSALHVRELATHLAHLADLAEQPWPTTDEEPLVFQRQRSRA